MSENRHSQFPSYNHAVSRHFFQLFFVLLLTFSIAIFLYGEPFHFWQDALSDLGCTVTRMGNPNRASRWVFAIGMIIESLILMGIQNEYATGQQFRNQRIKRSLALFGAGGFIVAVLPNDHYHTLHSIGTGVVVGALYFFAMIYHFELSRRLTRVKFVLDLILLQVSVFPYAVSFFWDWTSKQAFQKLCIIGVFYILLRSVSIAKESFEPRELFNELGNFFH
jgi:hypothetical membrane protein